MHGLVKLLIDFAGPNCDGQLIPFPETLLRG
jgi:hypothetical protein